jgi:hypothetical protein
MDKLLLADWVTHNFALARRVSDHIGYNPQSVRAFAVGPAGRMPIAAIRTRFGRLEVFRLAEQRGWQVVTPARYTSIELV